MFLICGNCFQSFNWSYGACHQLISFSRELQNQQGGILQISFQKWSRVFGNYFQSTNYLFLDLSHTFKAKELFLNKCWKAKLGRLKYCQEFILEIKYFLPKFKLVQKAIQVHRAISQAYLENIIIFQKWFNQIQGATNV